MERDSESRAGNCPGEALKIAEIVAAVRHDIFTEDALAWTYFKLGRLDQAVAASASALRTGTRDEQLLLRAAQIRAASRAAG
jgi:hypothetical protein